MTRRDMTNDVKFSICPSVSVPKTGNLAVSTKTLLSVAPIPNHPTSEHR